MRFGILKPLNKESRKLLSDKQAFFDALGWADPSAIKLLAEKIRYDVKQAAHKTGLSSEDAEEILNDVIVVTISNIQNQTFQFTDFSPVTYGKGVLRKLMANRLRAKKPPSEALDVLMMISEYDPESYLLNKELVSAMGSLLKRLDPNCEQLLQLKFFHNLRDQEIVAQKLTPYTSTNSIKSRRNQCMNHLIKIARESGILDEI